MIVFNSYYFLIGLLLGLLIIYFISPQPEHIILNPSIDDEISNTYIDENDVVYKYHRIEI